jgi:hypothetical protein
MFTIRLLLPTTKAQALNQKVGTQVFAQIGVYETQISWSPIVPNLLVVKPRSAHIRDSLLAGFCRPPSPPKCSFMFSCFRIPK